MDFLAFKPLDTFGANKYIFLPFFPPIILCDGNEADVNIIFIEMENNLKAEIKRFFFYWLN